MYGSKTLSSYFFGQVKLCIWLAKLNLAKEIHYTLSMEKFTNENKMTGLFSVYVISFASVALKSMHAY